MLMYIYIMYIFLIIYTIIYIYKICTYMYTITVYDCKVEYHGLTGELPYIPGMT